MRGLMLLALLGCLVGCRPELTPIQLHQGEFKVGVVRSAWCADCAQQASLTAIGTCQRCGIDIPSCSDQLCSICALELNQCCGCRKPLQ